MSFLRRVSEIAWPEIESQESNLTCASYLGRAQCLLARKNFLALIGSPDSELFDLATQLGADTPDDQRIWIDCTSFATDLIEVAWLIAHKVQNDDLWAFLEADRERPYPGVTRVGQVAGTLSQGNYLICFDALHHAYDKPGIVALVRSLAARAASGQTSLKLIVTAQSPPPFISEYGYLRLPGIEAEAITDIFARHGVKIADEALAHKLHTDLGSSPQLLDRAAAFVADVRAQLGDNTPPLEQLLEDTLTNERITFELWQTFEKLSQAERYILYALSLFEEAVEPDLLKIALAGVIEANVRFKLYGLQSQGRVLSEAPTSKNITLTPVMRHFYREAAEVPILHRLHHNLAEHFARLGDFRQATEHYLDAGESQQAADFLLRYADYTQNPDDRILLANLINDRVLRWPAVRDLSPEIEEKLKTHK